MPSLPSSAGSPLGVTAYLGPTNTGKTFMAIERMLSYKSGVIGLPLRLLAREVYQTLVERIGVERVALVTGEERLKPLRPDYWVATVESMPLDLDVEFIAVDEIQLAADLDRGHTFTDRILNLRGSKETLLLGSQTIKPLLERLLPRVSVQGRERFSRLSYAGHRKLSRLPPRTAIIAFSADQVYAIAEFIKRERGGAAVILGALSPRTRNAQVGLYQSGEVDYFVATDAVGMGLNLDVDHVSFAGLSKFDGFQVRPLRAAEIGQIAGRAGRYQRDGTFGVTGQITSLDSELVEQLEKHDFEPEKVLQWRNSHLDFSSLSALHSSLHCQPGRQGLVRAPNGEDIAALEHLMAKEAVCHLAEGRTQIETLWECCQVPDYRKLSPSYHWQIIEDVFHALISNGLIDNDWFAAQLKRCDNKEGDIDTLTARIADVRTWAYIANRENWLDISEGWQQKTREIEDSLSDRLHQMITQKFVDRKTSVLMRRLKETKTLQAEINDRGELAIEGEQMGKIQGFRFVMDKNQKSVTRLISDNLRKTTIDALKTKAEQFLKTEGGEFSLSSLGDILWRGEIIGRLRAGSRLYRPEVELFVDDGFDSSLKSSLHAHMTLWVQEQVSQHLGSLLALEAGEGLEATERGLAHRIAEQLGLLERQNVAEEVKALDSDARRRLRACGVKIAAYYLFTPQLLKPASRKLALLLAALAGRISMSEVPALNTIIKAGRTSLSPDPSLSSEAYLIGGYRSFKMRVVRVDMLERVADLIREVSLWRANSDKPRPEGALNNGFLITPAMLSLLGCGHEDMRDILQDFGYSYQSWARSDIQDELKRYESEEATDSKPDQADDDNDPFPVPEKLKAERMSREESVAVPQEEVTSNPITPETSISGQTKERSTIESQKKDKVPEMVDVWVYQVEKSKGHLGKDRKKSTRQTRQGGASKQDNRRHNKKKQGQTFGHQQKSKPVSIDPDSPFAKLADLIQRKD